ncbi:uracil-DNA glycosylase [Bacillus sp. V59.32b]|nr:uracil-DNA glycosylase [Bacillus sp. V59.32b]RFU67969.1 uracil-DNA glycosylase [Bacillus sp. V59.32b]
MVEKINCMTCKHYYVTWDPHFPKGCKAFQFKTSAIPSQEVLRSSGQRCMKYEKKHVIKKL